MSVSYALPKDCVDIVSSLSGVHKESNEIETALTQSLLDASRIFESDLFAPADYFNAAGELFTTKRFYSNGTSFVRLDPFVSVRSIRDTENDLIDSEEYRLYTSQVYFPTGYYLQWQYRSCGFWFRSSPISISARWGFDCIPPDVKIAVKNMGCLMFLVNSQNRLGKNDDLSSDQEQRLRGTYNRIVSAWQQKFHHKNLGIS